jgi:hypothetical protein
MVDINLFKDEEEESWKTGPEDDGGGEDELKDDLVFGDEMAEPSLDDDALFGEDEAGMDDLREEEPDFQGGDEYRYGEMHGRKKPVILWVALVVVLVGLGFTVYQFVLKPRLGEGTSAQKKDQPGTAVVRRPLVSQTSDQQAAELEETSEEQPAAAPVTQAPAVSGSIPPIIDSSIKIFQDLAQRGRFAAVIISRGQFHVEYVSETPNVAEAMGHRMKTLLGVSNVTVSKEDRHRTGGKIYYWGVVSGSFPGETAPRMVSGGARRFASIQAFEDAVSRLIRSNQLRIKEVKHLSVRAEGGTRYTTVRVKVEGQKNRAIAFLNALKTFPGNYHLEELVMAPVRISDFYANETKVVLDFSVETA